MIPLDRLHKIVQNEEIELALVNGIHVDEFKSMIATSYLGTAESQQVYRMNLIGSLRSDGFIVSGGRGGGDIYKVTDWVKVEAKKIEWSTEQMEVLNWYEDLPDLEEDNASSIRARLGYRTLTDLRHENTWMYIWGYELVGNRSQRAQGKLYRGAEGWCVIKRTFVDRPRFTIIDINSTAVEIDRIARKLALCSLAPIKVINPDLPTVPILAQTMPFVMEQVAQPVYDLERIANEPEMLLSRQSWKTARKMLREIEFTHPPFDMPIHHHVDLIVGIWRKEREGTQARPAIQRDYAIGELTTFPQKIQVLGFHGPFTVSYRCLERLANNTYVASDLVEKSFNKSSMPGGHSGISDASLVHTARYLLGMGIKYINGGESASVGPLLTRYKHKYQTTEYSSSGSLTLVLRIPHFKP